MITLMVERNRILHSPEKIRKTVNDIEMFVTKRPALEAVNTVDSLKNSIVTETGELSESFKKSTGDIRFDPSVVEEIADPIVYLIQLFGKIEGNASDTITDAILREEVGQISTEEIEAAATLLEQHENQLENAQTLMGALIVFSLSHGVDIISVLDIKNDYNETRFPVPPFFLTPKYFMRDRKITKFLERFFGLKKRILYPKLRAHAEKTYGVNEGTISSTQNKTAERMRTALGFAHSGVTMGIFYLLTTLRLK